MIEGTLIRENPFGLSGLFWREGRFLPEDEQGLIYPDDPLGSVSVGLPAGLKTAVAKRRSEYLAGRICAALALREAGFPEVVGQSGRAPAWPEGAVGSISHTDCRVVAVVASNLAGLGVDCETIMDPAQAEDLHRLIMVTSERSLRPEVMPFPMFLTLVFSAKEALYKALSSGLNRVLDFHEVSLTGIAEGRLWLGFEGRTFEVLYQTAREECLTLVRIKNGE